MLAAAGAVIFFSWRSQKNEQYKTGIMDGGELCVAYRCEDSVSAVSFTLEGSAVAETSRFAFSRQGYTLSGRIYKPVSEGSAVLYTSHTEKAGAPVYERFDITVDGSMNISFTQQSMTAEEFSAGTNAGKQEQTAEQ